MLGNYTEIRSDTRFVTIDIETLDPNLKESGSAWARNQGHILGIGCKLDNEPAQYYPLRHKGENYVRLNVIQYFNNLFKICYHNKIPIGMHYGYYDLGWLQHEGFMDIEKCPPIFDTLIIGQLWNSLFNQYSLKALCNHFHVGEKMDVDMNLFPNLPIEACAKYACNDVDITYNLAERLMKENINKDAIIRECKIIPILVMMKRNGIKIDQERLKSLEMEFKNLLYKNMQIILKEVPKMNIWSAGSVEVLFRKLNLTVPRTEKGNPSFEGEYLEEIGETNPVVKAVYNARKLDKLISTFIGSIKEKQYRDKIHCDYFNGRSDYGGTITGRLSSANPNNQQIPIRTEEGFKIRELYIPDNGIALGRFDYSQQEPRLMLHYGALLKLNGIAEWRQRYEENPDTDFYDVLTETTKINDRGVMKTNTLALSYFMGVDKMASKLKVSVSQAQQYKDTFFAANKWLVALRDFVVSKANREGWIKTLGGRVLQFNNKIAHKSFNHLIQGSGADQIKEGVINVWEELRKIPVLLVHDESVYELDEEDLGEKNTHVKIQEQMRDAFKLEFPVKVDFGLGSNWREACEK